MEAGIPVIQPERLRQPEAFDQLTAWEPQLLIVAAYGQILRQNVLDLPKYGCINVHASLLPRWRGASPVQAALLHGDTQTGVTIMKMDAGVDTGAVLAQKAMPIDPDENSAEVTAQLADLGAGLLLETLPAYLEGRLTPVPQDESGASYAPMIRKEDGILDFRQPANQLKNKIRAFNPWPGTTFEWEGQILKIFRVEVEGDSPFTPGQRGVLRGLPAIGTGQGSLLLEEVQPAGKKPMTGKVFLNGARGWAQNQP
jgi:methionyl-tRNA formyltransferase